MLFQFKSLYRQKFYKFIDAKEYKKLSMMKAVALYLLKTAKNYPNKIGVVITTSVNTVAIFFPLGGLA
jgi:hypothetical protein